MKGQVRPTTSKVLESLVATLGPYWAGARVLDLFAGSGSLGKAALAQGAGQVVMVEGDPSVAAPLRRLKPARVVQGRLPAILRRLDPPFDLILGDPPYGSPEGLQTFQAVAGWLSAEGWLVWEHHHKDPYPERFGALVLERRRRFGETALSYYRPEEPA